MKTKLKTLNDCNGANKSGLYKKDLDDWIYLCPKCHYEYDKQELRKIK